MPRKEISQNFAALAESEFATPPDINPFQYRKEMENRILLEELRNWYQFRSAMRWQVPADSTVGKQVKLSVTDAINQAIVKVELALQNNSKTLAREYRRNLTRSCTDDELDTPLHDQ